MKKKLFTFLACAVLVLSIGAAAYAASTYTMTYRPGTTDSVTGMPQNDDGTNGEAYTVSSAVPQREGYEFLGWKLDYAGMTSYSVRYLEKGTNAVLANEKVVPNQSVGATVPETAVNISGYNLIGDARQSKTLGQNTEENVITFYYEQRPALESASDPTFIDYITDEPYIVHHVALGVGELATEWGTALAGEPLTVYARYDLDGFSPLNPTDHTWETVPCNHVLEYQEFQIFENDWYRIIPGNELTWQIDGLQQNCVVAQKDDQYIIWTKDQLTEEEQLAFYESFRTHVYGMSDAAYENCMFMYANGSCLAGVTIRDDDICFDADENWTIAIGYYLPAYELVYEKGGDTLEWTFLYNHPARF